MKLEKWRELTDIVEQLVALVKDEHLQVLDGKSLFARQVKDTAWGANDDVGSLIALEQLRMLLNGLATIDDLSADFLHELGESVELFLDLVSQLSGVAQNKSAAGRGAFANALQDGDHEDRRLTHSRHGLAEHVNAQHCLGNATLLDVRGVLKTTVGDALLQLWLKEHVFEAG